jgi:arylsulfatase
VGERGTGGVPPDVVVVMTDQQRYDQVGFAAGSAVATPALESLAAGGVVFETAYSGSSTCVPARNALLTGVLNHRLPKQHGDLPLREGTWTVARALRAAGYQTALIGKMHFTPMHADHGFDVVRTCEHLNAAKHALAPDGGPDLDDYAAWLVAEGLATWGPLVPGEPPELVPGPKPEGARTAFPWDLEHHATTWLEREVADFLEHRDATQPLFLVVSFPHPHPPINPPEPYASRHDPDAVTVPVDTDPGWAGLPEPFRHALSRGGIRFRGWRVAQHGEAALRRRLAHTLGLLDHLDETIGRIVAGLDSGRTIVAFTSDHGDFAGNRGLAGKVPWIPFDDLVRVPFAVTGPGVVAGRRVSSPVRSFDLAPTLCELAGVAAPVEEMDGRSLVPELQGRAGPVDDRPVVFCTDMGWPAARKGRWKYILRPQVWAAVLFDLESDPGEITDLIAGGEHRHVEEELADVVRTALGRGPVQLPAVDGPRPPVDAGA